MEVWPNYQQMVHVVERTSYVLRRIRSWWISSLQVGRITVLCGCRCITQKRYAWCYPAPRWASLLPGRRLQTCRRTGRLLQCAAKWFRRSCLISRYGKTEEACMATDWRRFELGKYHTRRRIKRLQKHLGTLKNKPKGQRTPKHHHLWLGQWRIRVDVMAEPENSKRMGQEQKGCQTRPCRKKCTNCSGNRRKGRRGRRRGKSPSGLGKGNAKY